jgi:ADP-ribose pyrophosphatase YjhB (NUDIX family)
LNSPFQYCPACGDKRFGRRHDSSWQCGACDFLLYRSPAAAVAAIIEHRGDILFTVRAKDPQAGKLDLPGGFVDNHETAEQALQRELGEELGLWEMPAARYLASFPNTYPYAGVDYQTLDLIYLIKLAERPALQADDDIVAIHWIATEEIPFEQVAFKSIRNALRYYVASDFQQQ